MPLLRLSSSFYNSAQFLCCIVIVSVAGVAHGQSANIVFADLVQQSGAAFIGTVTAVDTKAGTRTIPRTRVRIAISKVLAGNLPSTLEFETAEGELPDGRYLHIPDAPKFTYGETYLIMYSGRPWAIAPVVGGALGYLRRVFIGARAVYVTHDGDGVAGLSDRGFVVGPRVAENAGQYDLEQRSGNAHRRPSAVEEMLAEMCVEPNVLEERVSSALASVALPTSLQTSPRLTAPAP